MTRMHHMDALRGVAMLLGIVLHVGCFLVPLEYWPVNDPWAYTAPPEQNPYGMLLSGIHGFRMPLFFLVSGFFGAMLWESRGVRRLIGHRASRVGAPLAVGMFTLVPVVAWQGAEGAFTPLDWMLAWWTDGLAHLWFLWYLLLMTALFAAAVRMGVQFRSRAWRLAVPLAFLPLYFMEERLGFGADTPLHVIPSLRVLAFYTLFFFYGASYRRRGLDADRRWAFAIAPAAVLHFAGLFLMHDPTVADAAWAWPAAALLQTVYVWLMCFGFLGLFRWVASGERFWVRYLSDASYWVYLTHLPLVIAGQFIVADWTVSVHLKFVLVLTTVVAGLLVVYQLGVRYTRVGAMLNGPRERRPALAA